MEHLMKHYITARVADAEDAGNSGIHQFGFTRYARVVLDTGKVIPNWRWDKRFPEEGDTIQVEGIEENLHSVYPSVRRVMAWLRGGPSYWGCVDDAEALLGLTSEEFYSDPEWWDRSAGK